MTRVDFYILSEGGEHERERFACRLAEKVYRMQHRIYLHTSGAEHSRRLDELLWTWRDGSFLPHGLVDQSGDEPEELLAHPVLIGNGSASPPITDLLINLLHDVPPIFSRFERVAEIVSADPQGKQAGRERYRFYLDRGYPLNQHNIQPAANASP